MHSKMHWAAQGTVCQQSNKFLDKIVVAAREAINKAKNEVNKLDNLRKK